MMFDVMRKKRSASWQNYDVKQIPEYSIERTRKTSWEMFFNLFWSPGIMPNFSFLSGEKQIICRIPPLAASGSTPHWKGSHLQCIFTRIWLVKRANKTVQLIINCALKDSKFNFKTLQIFFIFSQKLFSTITDSSH